MKTTTRSLPLIIVGAMLVMGFSATASAQQVSGRDPGTCMAPCPGQGDGPGMRRGPGQGQGWHTGAGDRWQRMADRLNLTDEQKTAIAEIRKQAEAKSLPLRKQIMQLQNDLRGEMLKDAPNIDTITKLVGKIGDLRTEMQVNRITARLDVRKQLTPEQRDKMLLMGGGDGPRSGRHAPGGQRPGRAPRMGQRDI